MHASYNKSYLYFLFFFTFKSFAKMKFSYQTFLSKESTFNVIIIEKNPTINTF
jgi:hypothetical protein